MANRVESAIVIEDPRAGCQELAFSRPLRLSPGGEGALEDYARALTGARHVQAIPAASDPACVSGLHLCACEGRLEEQQSRDLEAFGRELETPTEAVRLAWN